jgi:hypothetical protein
VAADRKHYSARVVEAHSAPRNYVFKVHAGETLLLGRRTTRLPGWRWAIRTDGRGGWIPASCLGTDGERATATALTDFDGAELNLRPGELLIVEQEIDDWGLARTGGGMRGWIPLRCIEPLTPARERVQKSEF